MIEVNEWKKTHMQLDSEESRQGSDAVNNVLTSLIPALKQTTQAPRKEVSEVNQ